MTIIPYPSDNNDDLDHLPPEQRAARLKFRRELRASLPRRPTAQDLHDRERQEAKAREAQKAKAPDPEAWTSWFNANFMRAIEEYGVTEKYFVDIILDIRQWTREYVAERLKDHPGTFPQIKSWEPETIFKAGSLASHDGSIYQAKRDTAQQPCPETSQWTLVVSSEHATGALPGLGQRLTRIEDSIERIREQLRGEFDLWAETERAELRDEVAKAVAEVRNEIGEKLAALEERDKQRGDARRAAVDQRIEHSVDVTRKLVGDALSEAIGAERSERRKEFAAALEEMRRSFEAKLAGLEEREKQRGDAWRAAFDQRIEYSVDFTRKLITDVGEAIATKRNDRRDQVAKEVDELRSALKAMGEAIAAEHGARRDEVAKAISELRSQLETIDKAVAAERRAQRDEIAALREEISQLGAGTEAKFAAHEERMKVISGKLPIAKAWAPETVVYQGAFVVHDGACWQALQDTAQRPGGCDWVCAARAGRDGSDGLTPNVCGVYDASKTYEPLDIVSFEGASYIARRDAPGLPGIDSGWQLLAARGKTGDTGSAGARGTKGDRGETGAMIHAWQVDRQRYRASPLMSDGRVGPMLELRGLFEQFQSETS